LMQFGVNRANSPRRTLPSPAGLCRIPPNPAAYKHAMTRASPPVYNAGFGKNRTTR
jgi:hypothetical protein